ncbi:MAG: hypothetical protein HYT12_04320 [Candidatus Liptonbacteria bacterium]|nr:hypothetical protein [Candidatus Liptonbacteria bacterium]
MSPIETLFTTFGFAWNMLLQVWWLLLPIVLFLIFRDLWVFYLKLQYLQKFTWTLLEVSVPREILRTPKAMEQVFAAVNGIDPTITLTEKWWKGLIVDWISFEMVGIARSVHFFIRVPTKYRNLIEAAIYAQYPGAEIKESPDDYLNILPENLPNQTYDLFGLNLKLSKEEPYPIRTYPYFEDIEEERRLDPLAAITEVMSRLREGEVVLIQLLVRPTVRNLKEEAKKIIEEMMGKKKIGADVEGAMASIISVTPGQRDVVKGIEEKLSKILLEANLRFIYVDHRANFTRSNASAIAGAFQQFNTRNMNGLKPLKKTLTIAKWPFFKQQRLFLKKRRLWNAYKKRWFADDRARVNAWSRGFLVNTEELATLYHFPASVVAAPRLERIEAKKGTPPANLPLG